MLSIEEIRKNYASFDNTRILRIAKKEAKGLKKETVPILIAEIKKRGLATDLIEWIHAERRTLSPAELKTLRNKVKNTPCKLCKTGKPLVGFQFTKATGILIDQISTHHQLIVCQSCGRKKRRNATLWTAIFGWWSGTGFFATPFILYNSIRSAFRESHESEALIDTFIHEHIGEITLSGDDEAAIGRLVWRWEE